MPREQKDLATLRTDVVALNKGAVSRFKKLRSVVAKSDNRLLKGSVGWEINRIANVAETILDRAYPDDDDDQSGDGAGGADPTRSGGGGGGGRRPGGGGPRRDEHGRFESVSNATPRGRSGRAIEGEVIDGPSPAPTTPQETK